MSKVEEDPTRNLGETDLAHRLEELASPWQQELALGLETCASDVYRRAYHFRLALLFPRGACWIFTHAQGKLVGCKGHVPPVFHQLQHDSS